MSNRETRLYQPKAELYYYDENTNTYKPLVDTDGLMKVKLEGSSAPLQIQETSLIIREVWQGTTTTSKNFATNMYGFSISNDGTADLTITLLTHTIVVKAGEQFDGSFDAFKSLTITGDSSYRALVRGE
ncbi:hypothetical protein Q7A53_06045 [Halobacillus rhizosphaerae]|uniref:hypothetical protein n=1 Tax=Halobacillus rhizosphaerae TaxID=3064889 RepID=UPI00398B8108